MSDNLIVVGVFKEEIRAESAVAVLRDVGFNNDQIDYARHTGKRGINHILENLVSMGVPEEEVSYYNSEFEAGRSIVVVRHGGLRSQTLSILLLNGARNHKYLKIGERASKESSNTSPSTRIGSHDQLETSQDSSANSSSKTADSHDRETLSDDEMESLRKLLEREGLDHLL